MLVVDTVGRKGPRTLGRVGEPYDEDVGRRIFQWVYGFLTGRTLVVVSRVVCDGVQCSYLMFRVVVVETLDVFRGRKSGQGSC